MGFVGRLMVQKKLCPKGKKDKKKLTEFAESHDKSMERNRRSLSHVQLLSIQLQSIPSLPLTYLSRYSMAPTLAINTLPLVLSPQLWITLRTTEEVPLNRIPCR